ncbi:MAG: hypothetical protein IPO19_18290 [Rhodoferax sp.]|nr:hypothetical protein [Rhodoferax sp.]
MNTGGAYDDALFLRLAQYLTQGAWLGPYTATTLVKGPGFPLWLAAVHGLQLPVATAASLTYGAACSAIFVALRPWIAGARQRVLIFAALLACPAALSDFAVMRELIYPALTLLVTACGLGLAARMDRTDTSIGPWCWAAALGLCSALFVLTREEWIWLSPMAIALVLWGLEQHRRGALAWRPLCGVYGFTCLFALLPLLVVASLNRHHYGVFSVSEFTSRPFVSAYGALTRVDHAAAPRQVPVPRETWSRIAAVSPSFALVHNHLQGPLGDIWLGPSAKLLGRLMDADPSVRNWLSRRLQVAVPAGNTGGAAFLQDRAGRDELFRRQIDLFFGGAHNAQAFLSGAMERESGGGWFVWMLREAVVASGQHGSAADANRFYQRLADEVNAACDQGRLQCQARRDTLRPALQWRDWSPFWTSLAYAMEQLVSMPGHAADGVLPHLGEPAALAEAESFLHDRLAVSRSSPMSVPAIAWLTVAYRYALPWFALVAVLAWLRASPWPQRRWVEPQRRLWLVGGLLLVLVLGRLALLALIHVTAWPAANDLRYLAPVQPLLVLFSAMGVLLAWPARRDGRDKRAIDAAGSE